MAGERRGPQDLPEVNKGAQLPTRDHRNIGGAKQMSNASKEAMSYLHAGHIVHVDTETMVCSVRLDSMQAERHDVPLPAPGGAGPRSWSGSIPEPGTKVVIGFKKGDASGRNFVPYILEFLTPGTFISRDYEPFSSANPADAAAVLGLAPDLADDPRMNLGVIRLKARKGYPGDYIASSSGGADFILDRDAYLTNRAGNEFRLRDADQTAILQTRNEFTSNAVGYYRRGLIKRNAFAFLPDLYPLDDNNVPAKIISPGNPANGVDPNTGEPLDRNPAYDILLQFGLIKADGTLNFEDGILPAGQNSSDTNPFYPPVVTPDGQHISYITHGEHVNSFANTLYGYTEDRIELRHLSDGTMAVTEEGDGFQIDPPFPVYIEDVKGTVVGNDFHSDAGRPLYKRVLGMRLFDSVNQGTPSTGPIYEPVDTVTRMQLMDALGLARLFRIQCPYPDSSNQFVLGITKEGKVLCHVPKTQAGEPHEKGKSIDLNVLGLIKMLVGADENNNNTSLDARFTGGINLDIGRFTGGLQPGASITMTLHGGVVVNHNGDPTTGLASVNHYNGNKQEAGTGSSLTTFGGNIINSAGGENAHQGQKITLNAGAGGLVTVSAGDTGETVLGKTQQQYGQEVKSMYALDHSRTHLLGTDSTSILVGSISRSVLAGTGISDSTTVGNFQATVGVGNYVLSVGTGNFSATVGAGSLALTASAGPASITSSLAATITSTALIALTAPVTKIGAVVAGFAVAGIPGPESPHFDYIVGIPILGVPTITIG